MLSPTDLECERVFTTRYTRDATGLYCVPLSFHDERFELLGDSMASALRALSASHRRMRQDPALKTEYVRFMEEYLHLGHMRRLTRQEMEVPPRRVNYLPHHGI